MSVIPEQSSELAERMRRIRESIRKHLERPVLQAPEAGVRSLPGLEGLQAAAGRAAEQVGKPNPRPPGLANELIQSLKRSCARALDWYSRPQREFNRSVVDWMSAVSRCLDDTNRSLKSLSEAIQRSSHLHQDLGRDLDSVGGDFEDQVNALRHQTAHEIGLAQESFEERMKAQRWALEGELFRIQEQLKPLRQRLGAQALAEATRLPATAPSEAAPPKALPALDYYSLEQRFRGTEEEVTRRQTFYLPLFQGRGNVVDLACGRGEFLALMRGAGVAARGVDLNADMVGRCLEKGLDARQGDIFSYLATLPPSSLDGVFCAHFVEHLESGSWTRLIVACAEKLAPSGILVMETPNPECLAIFSQTFFLDPTHVRPIPPALLRFAFAEAGLSRISTHFLSPASSGLPLVPTLGSQQIEPIALRSFNAAVTQFNETFFGGMDYCVIGYRADSL